MWDSQEQLKEKFATPPVEDVFELHDKTLGIIGLGRIGSQLAKKAAPLFKEIVAADPYKPADHFQELGVRKVSLSELIETSSVISLHCNLTTETRNILGKEAFQNMQNRPVIVNTSRGETIDEKALLEALVHNWIHSAGLDVYHDEPTTEAQQKLINHPRTICTGHYAWYSNSSAVTLQKRAALNLYHFLTGKEVEDRLNF
jgi:D-3-phosphoglycerate dehydrogenase